jgi:Class II Aldolase and Adducin N-terminal domain
MSASKPHTHSHPGSVAVDDSAQPGLAASAGLIADLVAANHILFDQGVVDAFGHVSVRHNARDDRFLLARNMAPGVVTADDIIEFTLDGDPVNAARRRVYLERFIHGEIYRRRPDVMSIVHSHSHSIVPLSVVKGVTLRALFHMAGFIGQNTPVFEIREAGGDGTDLLISNQTLGHRPDARPRFHRGRRFDPTSGLSCRLRRVECAISAFGEPAWRSRLSD